MCNSAESILKLSDVPLNDLKKDLVWIKVKASSKMKNLIRFALESIHGTKHQILLSGIGPAISKTVSCAEIIKRNAPNIRQVNKIAFLT